MSAADGEEKLGEERERRERKRKRGEQAQSEPISPYYRGGLAISMISIADVQMNFHPTVVSSEGCSSPVVGQSDFARVGRLMTLLPSIIGRHWCRGAPLELRVQAPNPNKVQEPRPQVAR